MPDAPDDWWGPIDYLVADLAPGTDPGAGIAELLALVDTGRLRLLDVEVFRSVDGDVAPVAEGDWAEVLGDAATLLDGAFSGLLDDDDRTEIAAVLEPGHAALVVVYEVLVTRSVVEEFRAAGIVVVDEGPLTPQEIDEALGADEGASA